MKNSLKVAFILFFCFFSGTKMMAQWKAITPEIQYSSGTRVEALGYSDKNVYCLINKTKIEIYKDNEIVELGGENGSTFSEIGQCLVSANDILYVLTYEKDEYGYSFWVIYQWQEGWKKLVDAKTLSTKKINLGTNTICSILLDRADQLHLVLSTYGSSDAKYIFKYANAQLVNVMDKGGITLDKIDAIHNNKIYFSKATDAVAKVKTSQNLVNSSNLTDVLAVSPNIYELNANGKYGPLLGSDNPLTYYQKNGDGNEKRYLNFVFDDASNIYMYGKGNTEFDMVYKYDSSTKTISAVGTDPAYFKGTSIKSIKVDKYGNIYVTCAATNTGRKTYLAKWDGKAWRTFGQADADVTQLFINGNQDVLIKAEAEWVNYLAVYKNETLN
jgi:hypothetical protein